MAALLALTALMAAGQAAAGAAWRAENAKLLGQAVGTVRSEVAGETPPWPVCAFTAFAAEIPPWPVCVCTPFVAKYTAPWLCVFLLFSRLRQRLCLAAPRRRGGALGSDRGGGTQCLSSTFRCVFSAFPRPSAAFSLSFLGLPLPFSLPSLGRPCFGRTPCECRANAVVPRIPKSALKETTRRQTSQG